MAQKQSDGDVAEMPNETPATRARQPRERIDGRQKRLPEPPPENKTAETGDEDEDKSVSARDWIGQHRVLVIIGLVVVVATTIGGLIWWLETRDFATTDDAFIDGRPVSISTEVAGAIVEVPVSDNQVVEMGAVLARIDSRDYQAALGQAQAQIEQAEAGIDNADAQIGTQQAAIKQAADQAKSAQGALAFSKDENARYQELVKNGAGTVQRAQQAASDLQQKQGALDAATAAKAQAEKQLKVLEAERKNADATLRQARARADQAQANLSRTTLVASTKGRVTRLTGAKGAYATPGQTLMILVPVDLWVTANYKETQLAGMRPGQKATIHVDAYDRDFAGHVDSIQAGSGTAFSLLPAENATGNYVKVVQRVPVKLVFDKPPDVELGPGMSVEPSVKVR